MEEKETLKKLKKEVEEKIEKTLENGIDENNVVYIYRLIDIHKDIENEDYWKKKEEMMMYRDYEDYNYGRRGVPGTGRGRYRGEDMIEDMHESYNDYTDNKEEYGRGNYGAKEDTIKSLDYMLKSVVQFMQMLEEDATSEEEMQLIKKYSRKISEM